HFVFVARLAVNYLGPVTELCGRDLLRPTTRTRSLDPGMAMGGCQSKCGISFMACETWAWPIKRASRPPGFTRWAAVGSTDWKRSTARRVTTLSVEGLGLLAATKSSARPQNTLTSVNVMPRITSRRKATFL